MRNCASEVRCFASEWQTVASRPMYPGRFAPIFRAKAKKHPEEQRHDPDRISRPRHILRTLVA